MNNCVTKPHWQPCESHENSRLWAARVLCDPRFSSCEQSLVPKSHSGNVRKASCFVTRPLARSLESEKSRDESGRRDIEELKIKISLLTNTIYYLSRLIKLKKSIRVKMSKFIKNFLIRPQGQPMIFPYTIGALIQHFPYRWVWNESGLVRYYMYGLGLVVFPLYYKISKKLTSPENKAIWKQKRKDEIEKHRKHCEHLWEVRT